MDPDVYRFSSGVCWRLPVPSAINKKTSVTPPNTPTPPHPTPIVGAPSQLRDVRLVISTPPPTPSLLGVAVCCEFYAGRLSFLPFSTEERRKDSLTLDFQGLFSETRSRLLKSICTSRNYYPQNKEIFVDEWCGSPLKRSVSIN